MKLYGGITQVRPDYNNLSWINIQDFGAGGIGAWLSLHVCPTYIIKNNRAIFIVQFENQAWADEWLDDYKGDKNEIHRLNPEANSSPTDEHTSPT